MPSSYMQALLAHRSPEMADEYKESMHTVEATSRVSGFSEKMPPREKISAPRRVSILYYQSRCRLFSDAAYAAVSYDGAEYRPQQSFDDGFRAPRATPFSTGLYVTYYYLSRQKQLYQCYNGSRPRFKRYEFSFSATHRRMPSPI